MSAFGFTAAPSFNFFGGGSLPASTPAAVAPRQPKIAAKPKPKLQKKSVHKTSTMPKPTPAEDAAIGPMVANPEQMGFVKHSKTHSRPVPKFLVKTDPVLLPTEFNQDPWDVQNQEKMNQLEAESTDVTDLYDTLKKMRENERTVMENKGLVDRSDMAKDLDEAIVFRGTCLDMCPVFERARRSVENALVRYEKDERNRVSRAKALKVFARPAAAAAPPLPSDVRPPHILVKTLDYIVDNIVGNLPDGESFLWDRMRSIRQDFTYQNYFGPEAIDCNERIVRIHLIVLHVMAQTDTEYSKQQELEQLHKALITLAEIYDEVRKAGLPTPPNEAEFRSYALLSKLRDPEYDKTIQCLPREILQNELVQLALVFRRLVSNSNFVERGYLATENGLNQYVAFFQLLRSDKVPFLMSSFLEVYVNEIRFYAMKAMATCVNKKAKPVPVNYFLEALGFNDENELMEFCKYYSIEADATGVLVQSLKHNSHILPDTKPSKQAWLNDVHGKMIRQSLQQLINSGKSNMGGQFDCLVQPRGSSFGKQSPGFGGMQNGGLPFGKQQTVTNTVAFGGAMYGTQQNTFVSPSMTQQNSGSLNFMATPLKQAYQAEQAVSLVDTEAEKRQQEMKAKLEAKKREAELKKKQEEERVNQLKLENEKKQILEAQRAKDEKDKKEKEKKEKQKLVCEQVSQNILSDIIGDVIKSEVKTMTENTLEKRQRTAKISNALSEELWTAFFNEAVYIAVLEAKADHYRKKSLEKRAWSSMKLKHVRVVTEKMKQRHLQEISRNLGVPTPTRKRRVSEIMPVDDIWSPLDWKSFYVDKLVNSMATELDIFIYSKNWESVSGKWLDSKFIPEEAKEGKLTTRIHKMPKVYVPAMFENLHTLIFDTGATDSDIFDLELKLAQDGEKLIEIVHAITLNTNYKFNIVLVYWDSEKVSHDKIPRLLRLKKIEKLFGSYIANVDIIFMDHQATLNVRLQQALQKIGNSPLKLSKRGDFNLTLRTKLSTPVVKKRVVSSRMEEMAKSEMEKFKKENSKRHMYGYLTKHIEASPRAKVTVLPSAQKEANIFTIPKRKISTSSNSFLTPHKRTSRTVTTPSYSVGSISTLSNVTFPGASPVTPFQSAPRRIIADSEPCTPARATTEEEVELPASVVKLKELVASVKKTLK